MTIRTSISSEVFLPNGLVYFLAEEKRHYRSRKTMPIPAFLATGGVGRKSPMTPDYEVLKRILFFFFLLNQIKV
jgi:hypothetical protein